jgi:hypothetical protein
MAQLRDGHLLSVGFNTGISVWRAGQYDPVLHIDLPARLTCVSLAPGGDFLAVGN